MRGDIHYDGGRGYVHAYQVEAGDTIQGFEVARVEFEQPDVEIFFTNGRQVIRNAASWIYL